jgi:hypothetical protein
MPAGPCESWLVNLLSPGRKSKDQQFRSHFFFPFFSFFLKKSKKRNGSPAQLKNLERPRTPLYHETINEVIIEQHPNLFQAYRTLKCVVILQLGVKKLIQKITSLITLISAIPQSKGVVT